ncbi:MAG: alpha/beta fold hydrolase [Caldilineaceae bacterium]
MIKRILLVLLLLFLTGCNGQAAYEPAAPEAAPIETGGVDAAPETTTFEFIVDDCPFAVDEIDAVTCGYLTVLEDRSNTDGLTLDLAVAIIDSLSDTPRPDPVLYLEGGPGGSALLGIEDWLASPLREERQIILFDQRGTGYSWPSLACPEVDAAEADETGAGIPPIEAVQACRDRLRQLGVDLSAYNSAASAADVHDLRQALGIDEWNLFGISYGTRLALTVVRDFPEGVRSVVLDSVYPPDVDAYTVEAQTQADAILALLDECAADAVCGAGYPDLAQDLYVLIDDLNAEPFETESDFLTGDGLVSELVSYLYDSTKIVQLPAAIGEAAAGNFDLWFNLSEDGADDGRRVATAEKHRRQDEEVPEDSQGMFYSVECNEETPFGDLDQARTLMEDYPPQLAEPLMFGLEELYAACTIWGAGEAEPRESAPVQSNIRTLLLAGQLDPVTPPTWAKQAAASLSNSLYVEIPRGGHSVSSDGDCIMQVIIDFYNDLGATPDIGCTQTKPSFVLP